MLDSGSFAEHDATDLLPQKHSKKNTFLIPSISFAELWQIVIPENGLDDSPLVLVKLDVEGLEVALLRDMVNTMESCEYIVLVEILTEKNFQEVFDLTHLRKDLILAEVDEYEQKVAVLETSEYRRSKGSRNFLFGTSGAILNISPSLPAEALKQYE